MQSPLAPYASVVIVKAGVFQDEKTQKISNVVVCLALVSFFVYLGQNLANILGPDSQALLKGDFTALGFSEYEITSARLDEFPFAATLIGGFVVGVLCWLTFFVAGCYGAIKLRLDFLRFFCFCNGLCACCSFFSILSVFTGFGSGSIGSCKDWEALGLNPGACYAEITLGIVLFILLLCNTLFSYQLIKRTEQIVQVPTTAIPVAFVQATPITPETNDILGEQKV